MTYSSRVLPLALFSILMLVQPLAGAKEQLSQSYDIDAFAHLVVSDSVRIEISQGQENSLRAIATEEVLERVQVDTRGDRLKLGLHDGVLGWNWFGKNRGTVTFVLEVADLSRISLTGASQATVEPLQIADLRLDVSGASRANLSELTVDSLHFNVSGASRVEVQRVNADRLEARISGSSHLDLQGGERLSELVVNVNGASHYRGADLAATTVRLEASGAPQAEVHAVEQMHISASGASHIQYQGNPRIEQHSSGASSIRSMDR